MQRNVSSVTLSNEVPMEPRLAGSAPSSRLRLVILTSLFALLGAVVPAVAHGAPQVAPALASAGTVSWTDDFAGSALDPRWQVVNEEPGKLAVSGGALHLEGQPGDTYQGVNSAKNLVMLDLPAGDFTATTTVSAAVAKVYQGAGVIAWKDMDNYVRSGLTFVGGLSPSGVAIENDVETGASFSAVKFTDRPGSTGETIRMERVGDTITTSVYDASTSTWLPAGSTTVSFDTTQVGLYTLAAQDGTVLPAAFDSFTIEHAQGADVTPSGTFVLQASGADPFLVADGDAVKLTSEQPTASLRLHAADLGDGALGVSTDAGPLVVTDGALGVGAEGDEPTPLRLTDAGGGKLVLRLAADDMQCVYLGGRRIIKKIF
jgi:regulation of enolase protein 1 (concanavalin A-like superfamily)